MLTTNKPSLSRRKKKFVEFYVESGQAVAAVEQAGYSAKRAERTAAALLKDPDVLAAIQVQSTFTHICEAESLVRLSDLGRGSMDHFLELVQTPTGEKVRINLTSAAAQEHMHLIKSITQQCYTMQTSNGPVEVVETGIELHCPMEAIKHILRIRGQYPARRVDITSNAKTIAVMPSASRLAEQPKVAERVVDDSIPELDSARQTPAR